MHPTVDAREHGVGLGPEAVALEEEGERIAREAMPSAEHEAPSGLRLDDAEARNRLAHSTGKPRRRLERVTAQHPRKGSAAAHASPEDSNQRRPHDVRRNLVGASCSSMKGSCSGSVTRGTLSKGHQHRDAVESR